MMNPIVRLLVLAGMCAADPTRFLVQNGKVDAAGSFAEAAKIDSKERFERAMQKLEGDRQRIVTHEREYAKKAKQLRHNAESLIHH